jgi:hypothetical protein
MTPRQWKALLKVASDNVPHGIYGVEKDDYGELMNISTDSIKSLKTQIRALRKEGFRVFFNV